MPEGTGGNQLAKRRRIVQQWVAARKEQGLELEQAPDPTGPMPIDDRSVPATVSWNNRRWAWWCFLHEGNTTNATADKFDIGPPTIMQMRSLWAIRYGVRISATRPDQVAVDPRYRRERSIGTAEEAHAATAQDLDKLALAAANVAGRWVEQLMSDTSRLAVMGPADVLKVLSVAEEAGKLAVQFRSGGARPTLNGGAVQAIGALSPRGRKPKGKGTTADQASAALGEMGATFAAYQRSRGGAEAAG